MARHFFLPLLAQVLELQLMLDHMHVREDQYRKVGAKPAGTLVALCIGVLGVSGYLHVSDVLSSVVHPAHV